ncbi:MAG: hypothetical protein NQU41_06305, partial [Candidatus Methanosuratincola sp.]|nr:hypothetical protein [Candidatus Methanosuratincola sp.]
MGGAKVGIYQVLGDGYYWVTEPPMGEEDMYVYNLLMNAIYYTLPPTEEKEPIRILEERLRHAVEEMKIE